MFLGKSEVEAPQGAKAKNLSGITKKTEGTIDIETIDHVTIDCMTIGHAIQGTRLDITESTGTEIKTGIETITTIMLIQNGRTIHTGLSRRDATRRPKMQSPGSLEPREAIRNITQ